MGCGFIGLGFVGVGSMGFKHKSHKSMDMRIREYLIQDS